MMNIKSMLVVTMFLVLPNIEVVSSAVLAVPLSAILERAEKAGNCLVPKFKHFTVKNIPTSLSNNKIITVF